MIFSSSQLAGNSVLPGMPTAVPVAATTVRVAVEYVRSPLGADADVLRLRPIRGINRIPSRTILVGRPTVTVRGNAKRLVVLLAATRLSWLGPRSRNVATRPATRHLPLGQVEIIVRLV